MNESILVLALFGGLVIGNSLLYSIYLIFTQPKKNARKLLISGLLISLSLRIFKSVAYFSTLVTIEWVPAIGLIGMACIGPFLFLFVGVITNQFKNLYPFHLLHFIFPMLIALTLIVNDSWTFRIGYHLTVLHLLIYLILSILINSKATYNLIISKFLRRLFLSVGIIWVAFLFQLIVPNILSYIAVTMIATIALFMMTLYTFQHFVAIFSDSESIDFNDPEVIRISNQLNALLQQEDYYKNFNVNSKSLAIKLQTKPYILSKIVNQVFKKSIPELINHYRIESVKKVLLSDPISKIEAVAFDNGFNTPSVFYKVFKKHTSLSPNEFREKHRNP